MTAPTTPYEWVVQLLTLLGSGRNHRGLWQCPAHRDAGPSLAVSAAHGDGRALVCCFAGCATVDVLSAIGMPSRYLCSVPTISPATFAHRVARSVEFPPVKVDDPAVRAEMRLEAVHPFGTPAVAWLLRFRHPATGEKACVWESLNHSGERVEGLGGRRPEYLPLYLERDAVAAAAMDEPVVLVESESSVDALVKAGIVATTWAGGAGMAPGDRLRRLLGGHRRLLVLCDGDDAGRRLASRLRDALPLARVFVLSAGLDARDVLDELGATEMRRRVDQHTTRKDTCDA